MMSISRRKLDGILPGADEESDEDRFRRELL